jgi:hypothetical protein
MDTERLRHTALLTDMRRDEFVVITKLLDMKDLVGICAERND